MATFFINALQGYTNNSLQMSDGLIITRNFGMYGADGPVQNVTVTMTLTHTHMDDLDICVEGPTLSNLLVTSDAGGGTDFPTTPRTFTFSDSAAAMLPDGGPSTAGTYKPSNYDVDDDSFAFLMTPSATTSFAAAFAGIDPNGTWRIGWQDDASQDVGRFTGFVINVTTAGSSALIRGGASADVLTVTSSGAQAGSYKLDSRLETIGYSGVAVLNFLAGDGVDRLNGGDGTERAFGEAGNDILNGNAGNDILDGGSGSDILNGGLDSDTYVLGSEPTGQDVVNDTGGPADGITSTISRTLADFIGIENLVLVGTQNANATGNDLANRLTGNAGNNTLDGRGGEDRLSGGAGNDTYVLGGASDIVVDIGGIDTVTSTVGRSIANRASIENLTLFGSATLGIGNGNANVIKGSAQANSLSGGSNNDTLIGNSGNDRLAGGTGRDTQTGGVGRDTFVYASKLDSKAGAGRDVIRDFDDSGDDKIDFSALVSGRLSWQGTDALTGTRQVHVRDIAGPSVLVEVNLSGGIAPEVVIELYSTRLSQVDAADFVL